MQVGFQSPTIPQDNEWVQFFKKEYSIPMGRGLFTTQSDIYDGAFFPKIVNDFQPLIIFTNSSIVDIRLDSKYVFDGDTRKTHENFEKHSRLLILLTYFQSTFTVDVSSRHLHDANGVVSGAFIVNFEHISHLVLVFLLLTLIR